VFEIAPLEVELRVQAARKIRPVSEMEAADGITPSAEALLGSLADQDSSVRRAAVEPLASGQGPAVGDRHQSHRDRLRRVAYGTVGE
jgi:hypothetical protein